MKPEKAQLVVQGLKEAGVDLLPECRTPSSSKSIKCSSRS